MGTKNVAGSLGIRVSKYAAVFNCSMRFMGVGVELMSYQCTPKADAIIVYSMCLPGSSN